jgi:hypothetical protein
MTPEERAAAVCREMAGGPLILEEPFDRWVERQVAVAVRAAVEEEREDCARLADPRGLAHLFPANAAQRERQSLVSEVSRRIAAAIRARGKA